MTFGTFCVHLVHFSGFGIKYQEKSGNPAQNIQIYLQNLSGLVAKTSDRASTTLYAQFNATQN
jgi:hypothetical protein